MTSFFAPKPSGLMRSKIDEVIAESRGGLHRSVFSGRGIEFKRLRPYSPHDRPAAVDDMASSRLSDDPALEPYSRITHTEKQISVVLLVNTGESMRAPRVKQEIAEILFWFLALSAFKYGDRFRLIMYAEGPTADSDWLGEEEKLTEFLMRRRNALGQLSRFDSVYSYLAELDVHDAVLYVVSDFANTPSKESSSLRRLGLGERNVKPVLCAIDEWEEYEPSPYAVTLYDPRLGRAREYGPEEMLELRFGARHHFSTVEEETRSQGAFFVKIPILSDPLPVFRRSLRRLGFR